MKRMIVLIIAAILSCILISGCGKTGTEAEPVTSAGTSEKEADRKESSEEQTASPLTEKPETEGNESSAEQKGEYSMVMTIGDTKTEVSWENNASVEELKELAKEGLTIQMSMYGGFEQVGSVGKSLTRDDKQTTTSAGDVVLYSGDQLVVFYGSNSWAYTRLGKINLSEKELKKLLGNGDVTITLSME